MYEEPEDRDLIMVDEALTSGVARWLPTLVVMTAVAGFVSLAWYAYHAGTQSVKDEDLIVVEADKSPMKEKPLDPGGMQFPDQDKTVFDTFSGKQGQPPKVERVLPTPEEPMAQADASGTVGFIKEEARTAPADTSKPEQVIAPDEKKPDAAPAVKTPKAEEAPKKPIVSETPKAAPAKTPIIAEVPAVNSGTKGYVAKKETAAPAKTGSPAAGGAVKAQLGAYRSENEALAAWGKMIKKYPDLLSGRQRLIVKADLGERGTYWRLRVPGFANAIEGKSFCDKLSAKGQACMLTGDK